MKNNGFTLIELLVVIVIIGVLLGIFVPNTISLINEQEKTRFNVHTKLVKNALDLYLLRYNISFSESNSNCFKLNYQNLLDEKILEEDKINCSNYIYLIRRGNSNNFKYEYDLICTNITNNGLADNKKIIYQKDLNESDIINCININ